MANATKQSFNRLAVVFDFDETLAPDSFDSLLESVGADPAVFMQERVQPLVQDGWDKILAKCYGLIEYSKQHATAPITPQRLNELGQNLDLFEGVPEMFERVRTRAQEITPDIEVEFYLITSGLVEIARATHIAHHFKEVWGCEFHYGADGAITFPKQIVTYTEKTRYLLDISRGRAGQQGDGTPIDLFGDAPVDELYIPLSQFVYVGDGSSDMPVFSLLNARRGLAIGVYKKSIMRINGKTTHA